jgi:hypothetical protein
MLAISACGETRLNVRQIDFRETMPAGGNETM